SIQTNRGVIYPDVVINCGGVFAEEIARMAGDRFFSIHPRRGTNSILDKKANHLIKSIASIKVFEKSPNHTKGGGMLHTVHDNVLVGPNAVETFEKENFATNAVDIKAVFDKQKNTAPKLSERDIITYFTGVRAPTFEEDFVIEKGHKTKNLIHCAGIQSPGLTTAPAVALDVEKMAIEILREKKNVSQNTNFNPTRHAVPVLRDMSKEERAEMIAKNPDYGIIICRCEEISKGEIIDALNLKLCVPTVDGIKKRLRPGMGRCQGGFCAPLVTKIIADFLGVPLEQVQKGNDGSNLTFGSTKEVR
ncbi:MAG: FAD-dependent oxidoreductase, partial [Clostridia bacterium]